MTFRKTLSVIVVCVLLCCSFSICVEANESEEVASNNPAVLLSNTSEAFREEIKKCNVSINPLSTVNIIKKEGGGTAFQIITVFEDGHYERSIVALIDNDGVHHDVYYRDLYENGAKGSTSSTLYVFSNKARIVISGSYSAVDASSWAGAVLLQPYKVAFYYIPVVSATMTNVTATYRTAGVLYNINTHSIEDASYTHTVSGSRASVSAATTYSFYNYLSTSKGIDTTVNYWNGEYLCVEGYYGGIWFSESYS